jgi:hypothetical protein
MVPMKSGRFNWLDNESIAAWTIIAPALLFLGTFLIQLYQRQLYPVGSAFDWFEQLLAPSH